MRRKYFGYILLAAGLFLLMIFFLHLYHIYQLVKSGQVVDPSALSIDMQILFEPLAGIIFIIAGVMLLRTKIKNSIKNE